MFIYQIELRTYVDTGEPLYLLINTHNYDLGLNEKDQVNFQTDFFGKHYDLKAFVVEKKDVVYMPSSCLAEYGDDAVKKGLFIRRVFIEAEDRDAVLEISEKMRKETPGKLNSEHPIFGKSPDD
jgi:hypothetical protein